MARQRRIRGSSGNPKVDRDCIECFVRTSIQLIRDEYELALKNGLPNPVVLLLDCKDVNGSKFARELMGEAEVDAKVDAFRAGGILPGMTLSLAYAFDSEALREIAIKSWPGLPECIPANPSPGEIPFVVMAMGGFHGGTICIS
jgi:hypothetical protein